MNAPALPDGLLMAWYGDDFTGSAAVMEVLSFAGLPARLFLDLPTPAQLAEAGRLRAFGVATTARTCTPTQMQKQLPDAFRTLHASGAPIMHYKVCSTLDSSPHVGSIGCAAEIGLEVTQSAWAPVVIAAPQMGRYQAFGNLFADAFGTVHRLDRHPVMARHPVTPMHEADVARHLAQQTTAPVACLTLADYLRSDEALNRILASGARLITLDAVDNPSMVQCGELLWTQRHRAPFVIGSQGIEYALVAYWRAQGLLAPEAQQNCAGRARGMAVVSGSVSPVTQKQIEWATAHGFEGIALSPASLLSTTAQHAENVAVESALAALRRGCDPLIYTSRGPDDPAVCEFQQRVAQTGIASSEANAQIGKTLGRILARIVQQAGLRRAVISGGDTSGHATRELGIYALEPLAPTIPGASICTSIADNAFHGLQLALKGGQMGSEDYFGWVRDGGGAR